MKEISNELITNSVKELCKKACHILNDYTMSLLIKAKECESNKLGKEIIGQIIKNDELAKKEMIPMCQDTGIVVVFLEIGYDIHFNGDIYEAINEGVRQAYDEYYLRKSVANSITRENTKDNTPAIVHTKFVKGDKLKITIAPKGAGSENMSRLKMLNPTDGIEGVKNFVLETVKLAGGRPCPPIVVGIGIGGNFETSALMSKEALLREKGNEDPILNNLEKELKDLINKTNIGPMGLGGDTTCLDVFINACPCHIASFPVAVNIQCHANRHVEVIL